MLHQAKRAACFFQFFSALRGFGHRRGNVLRVKSLPCVRRSHRYCYLSPPAIPDPFKCAAAVVQLRKQCLRYPPLTHDLWVFGRFDHTPWFITHPHLSPLQTPPVGVRTCYHTPWFITPRRGPPRPALYHRGNIKYHTPHMIPHPVIIFLSAPMYRWGCVFLCGLRYVARQTAARPVAGGVGWRPSP